MAITLNRVSRSVQRRVGCKFYALRWSSSSWMADADRWRDAFRVSDEKEGKGLPSSHTDDVTLIEVVPRAHFSKWLLTQPQDVTCWLQATGFSSNPKAQSFAFLPAANATAGTRVAPQPRVVFVANDAVDTAGGDDGGLSSPFAFSSLPTALPPGRYAFDPMTSLPAVVDPALSWALGSYKYRRYKQQKKPMDDQVGSHGDGGSGSADAHSTPALEAPVLVHQAPLSSETAAMARATFLVRDLINTPAEDCGPADVERAAMELATALKATSVKT